MKVHRGPRLSWVAVPSVVQVEPLTTARALRGPFDYLRPEGVEVGSVLVVPFGHRDVVGVVTGLAEGSEHDPVAPRARPEARLPAELVDLALWMAARVLLDAGARALAPAAPEGHAGARPRCGPQPRARRPGERLSDRQRALLASLPRFAGGDLAALRRLEGRGLVGIVPRVVRRAPAARRPSAPRASSPS